MTPAPALEAAPAEPDISSPPAPFFRHPRRLLLAGLGAGVLAHAWFVDVPLGIGVPLFALGFVAALRLLGGRESWQRARGARWLLVPMLLCAGFVAVRDSPTLTAINLAAAAGLALLAVQLFSGEQRASGLGVRGYLAAAFKGAGNAICAGPVLVHDAVDAAAVARAARTWGGPALRAFVFATPVVALFGALLISADAVVAGLASRQWEALLATDGGGLLTHLGVVGGIGLLTSGLWAWALRRRPPPAEGAVPLTPRGRGLTLGPVEAFAVVGSVLLLFAGFGAVQAACLFGEVALPAELTWSDYARQGFFQLLVVAGLTLALLTGLSRTASLPGRLEAPFAAACTAVVALTWLILASAVKRLHLYEEAYGFTELRVYSHLFAFALAAMLCWRAVTLWRFEATFATGALISALGYVLALNLLNPDALIVRANLARFADGKTIDSFYLSSLSADATPALLDALPEVMTDSAARAIVAHDANTAGRRTDRWAGWHLGRQLAANRLRGPLPATE